MIESNQVYIAIDLHSKHSKMGYMNEQGEYLGQQGMQTTAQNLIGGVVRIPAARKFLTLEQGNMAFWAAERLRGYVDELIVCDPRQNHLISRSMVKNDDRDTYQLCQLLRLGALKPVWRPKRMGDRRLFYHQIKEYQRLNKALTTNKRQLQAMLRHWGYNQKLTKADYARPEPILDQITPAGLAREVEAKFTHIDMIARAKHEQFERITQAGRGYPEIIQFQKMSGMGPVGAHTFSGYIQTPYRFQRRGQLIRFCQLAVRKASSDGRRLRAERLSKAGHGPLKNVAHTVWKSAMKSPNEVSGFYQASLARCGDPVKARLNTQRKILITLWSIWKHNQTYSAQKFFCAGGDSPR